MKKSRVQLDREIKEVLSRSRSSHSTKYDRDDAHMFGQYAYRMEQTKAQALSNARSEGFGSYLFEAVEKGWDDERQDTIAGGFAHATRRKKASKKAPRPTPYRIQLTPAEMAAVHFAQGRYSWADMLASHAAEDGSVAFTESEMWQWVDDVDEDDGLFPLAAPALASKLGDFHSSVV